MPDTTLTLVSAPLCPFVQRAAITFIEKDAPFERVHIDLTRKPDWFLDISPLGRVPLLKVERPEEPDAVLFESSVISEFIDETQAGPKLHPADPVERAVHRAWMEFGSSLLTDLYVIQTTREESAFDARQKALAEKAARVEAVLSPDGPYFAGASFSLVDAVFAPAFRIVDAIAAIVGVDLLPPLPRLSAWRLALAARPSVTAAVADDYLARFEDFIRGQNGHLLARAA